MLTNLSAKVGNIEKGEGIMDSGHKEKILE
jgi:hypothetical protein